MIGIISGCVLASVGVYKYLMKKNDSLYSLIKFKCWVYVT
jgi:hypothetical protein